MCSEHCLPSMSLGWEAYRPVVVGGKGRQPSSSAGYPKRSHKGDDSCRQQLQPQ